MTATPEQKRCLAMAATDAGGKLRWTLGGWRRPQHPDDKPISSVTIQECKRAGWLMSLARRTDDGVIFEVGISQTGAQEALRP